MNDAASSSLSVIAVGLRSGGVECVPLRLDQQKGFSHLNWPGSAARQFAPQPAFPDHAPSGEKSERPSTAGAERPLKRVPAEPADSNPSKSMHGHPSPAAQKKTTPRPRRISVTLTASRLRRLGRLAAAEKSDKSALIANAVEAVYGHGARFVRLRSTAQGLARLMILLTLVDNRIVEIGTVMARLQPTGLSEEAFRVVALARLEAIHEGLAGVIRVVASWRAHDHAAAGYCLGESSGDMSPCEGGGGI